MSFSKYFLISIAFAFILTTAFLNAQAQLAPKPDFFLFWSADTYIPNDYPGKALPVYDSWVTVTAVASGKGVNPEKLVYYWWVNDQFQEDATGLGRKNFRHYIDIVPPGANIAIRSSIENENKSIDLEKTIIITTASPEVGLYRYNPAAKRASPEISDEYAVKFGGQIDFIAKPFFFSIQKLEDLVFKWLPEGGSEIEGKKPDPNILSLKIPSGADLASLISRLGLSVQNPFSSIQRESVEVGLNVGQ